MTRAIVWFPPAVTMAGLLQPIAGVPTLLRLLLSAQRAGIGEIFLLSGEQPPGFEECCLQDHRLRARLVWLQDQPWSALSKAIPNLAKQWWTGDLWVLPANAVIDATLLREAAERPMAQPIAAIEGWPDPAVHGGPMVFRVAGPWLSTMLETCDDIALSIVLHKLPQRLESERIPNNGRVCVALVTADNRAEVERQLFAGLQRSADGWVDRYLNRRLSPWLSRWLLRTPLTPNQVTLLSLAVGLMAALSFARGGWLSGIIGALLLQWSAIIDCCDGEVARLKFLESPRGSLLDMACDNVVHVAVFAAIGWSSYRELGHAYLLVLGGLGAFGASMAFVVVMATRHGRVQTADAGLNRLIDALTNRDFSILIVLCALLGKLEWFLWALAIGVNLFWPIALGLAWRRQRPAHG